MSAIVCFSLTLTLMIINAVVGISIRLNFYLLLFTILTAGFTLVDSKTIFYSKKVKKSVKSKTVRKTKKVQSHTKAKRKIS